MNISRIFIIRPVMTTLLTAWLVLMSLFAYYKLPVSALPRIDYPVIQVRADLAGANPETISQSVAVPLEQKFSSIPGLEVMTSKSAQGTTTLTLQFALSVNIDTVAQDVNTAISSAQGSFPPEMTKQPTFKKLNPSEQPVIFLALSSDTLPIWQVCQFAQEFAITRLSMLQNVAQVEAIGQQKYAVRIYVKPELLKARDIGIDLIASNVAKANTNTATGLLQGSEQIYAISPLSSLKNAKEFSEITIKERENLKLKEIATVVDDVDNLYTGAWFKGKRGLILAVSRQPGSNAIEVVDQVKKILPEIRKQLPQSINLDILVDRTESIKESIKEVKITGVLTIALVIAVIFLFFQNIQATLIPSLSLPISVVITFSAMYFLGFSLNNLTFLALILATGFIIDDSIVVLENILAHREKGLSSLEAAIQGSKEISFTVLSITISLVAVFIPILFLPGIVGRMFYEFSMTVTIAILASGFVSLTLIPMLSQYLSEQESSKASGLIITKFQSFYEWLETKYKETLEKAFAYQNHIIKFVLATLFLNVMLYIFIPKGFFPNEDTGLIYGVTETLPETSFDSIKRIEENLMGILNKNPYIESFNASIGASTTTVASNEGRFFIRLKPLGSRPNVEKVMNDLRRQFSSIPDLKVSMQPIQNLRVGGTLSKSQYLYTIQAQSLEDLAKYTAAMEDKLKQTPGFLDVATDLKMNSLQAELLINRDIASRMNLSVADITTALGYAYAEQQISTIYTDSDAYPVIIGIEKKQAKSLQDLSMLYLTGQDGLVPLSSLVTIQRKNAPLTINHLNRLTSAGISFNLKPGFSLSEAVQIIEDNETKLSFPPTVMGSFQGTAQAFASSQNDQVFLLIAAIFTIYIILGVLYESYKHPLTILSGLPSAGLGALIALWVLGFELNTIGFIGIILLIGIVKKNAIMMIDYALSQQRLNNLDCKEAIILACHRRFRPIMMTTLCAVIGAIPIAIWQGAGAELRRPLGVCIIGGLLVSQWLTLYITPLLYVWMEKHFSSSVRG